MESQDLKGECRIWKEIVIFEELLLMCNIKYMQYVTMAAICNALNNC